MHARFIITQNTNVVCANSTGVTKVDTNVAEQSVVVHGTADPNELLAALQRWGAASGKSVELVQ